MHNYIFNNAIASTTLIYNYNTTITAKYNSCTQTNDGVFTKYTCISGFTFRAAWLSWWVRCLQRWAYGNDTKRCRFQRFWQLICIRIVSISVDCITVIFSRVTHSRYAIAGVIICVWTTTRCTIFTSSSSSSSAAVRRRLQCSPVTVSVSVTAPVSQCILRYVWQRSLQMRSSVFTKGARRRDILSSIFIFTNNNTSRIIQSKDETVTFMSVSFQALKNFQVKNPFLKTQLGIAPWSSGVGAA